MTRSSPTASQNLDIELFKSYIKALEVMVTKTKAMIRQYEAARLDLSIPSMDGFRRKTYTFPSSEAKMQFLEELRKAKLRSCECIVFAVYSIQVSCILSSSSCYVMEVIQCFIIIFSHTVYTLNSTTPWAGILSP